MPIPQYTDTGSFKIVAAGLFTTAGGDTTETITASGVVSSDLVFVFSKTGNASVVRAAAGTDQITVTTSADPGNDDVLQYIVVRAI